MPGGDLLNLGFGKGGYLGTCEEQDSGNERKKTFPLPLLLLLSLSFLYLGLALFLRLNSPFVSFLFSFASLPPSPIASLFLLPHLPLFCSLQRNGRNQIPLPLGLASSN